MTDGVIFTQKLQVGGGGGFAALLTGAGAVEKLLSIDPAGQLATLETTGDIAAVDIALGRGADLVRYRCRMATDSGPVDEPYGALMLVAFAVPPERKPEVDDWYLNEHIALLMRADGWLRARRYEVEAMSGEGAPWTNLAFHELRNVSVMDSEERRIARSTAWRAELETERWFQTAGRWVFLPER